MRNGIWLNTCLKCGTNNAAPEMRRPVKCSGCGEELECCKQEWYEGVGILHEQNNRAFFCEIEKRRADKNASRAKRKILQAEREAEMRRIWNERRSRSGG